MTIHYFIYIYIMRVIDFGKQIAEFGGIVDYKSVNYLWDVIYKMETDKWKDYKAMFKPLLNSICSEFVKLCLKPIG